MRKKSTTRSWDASPFRENERISWVNVVIYLISYFAAGDSLRSDPPTIVLTLRADFVGQALTYRPFTDALQPRLNRNLTPEEWKQYLGDEPYRKTFPDLP
jgi:hypothetical protein